MNPTLLKNLFLSQHIASEEEIRVWAETFGLQITVTYPDGPVNGESGILVDLSTSAFEGWSHQHSGIRDFFHDPKGLKRFNIHPAGKDEIPEFFPFTRYEVTDNPHVAVIDNLHGRTVKLFSDTEEAEEWLNHYRPNNLDVSRYWQETGLKGD